MGGDRIQPSFPRKEYWLRLLAAALVYAVFLGLAAAPHYMRGPGLFKEVIWDPAGLYSCYTGDQAAIRALKAGYFPLWDPTRGLGAVNVVPTGATIDHPLKILAYLMNSDFGWEVYVLLRLWLSGIFLFVLARELGLRFPGALLAGLSFMLCGYFREFQIMADLNVLLLAPLVFFCVLRIARTRRLLPVLAMILVGHWCDNNPESMAYLFILFTAFNLSAFYIEAGRRKERGLALFQYFMFYFFCVTGFLLLDSDSMWPFLEYYRRGWHFHPQVLGQLHVPAATGVALATPLFDFWMVSAPNLDLAHLEQLAIVPAYLGIVTFIFALVALLSPRRLTAHQIFFSITTVVLAGLIFGAPPFHLLLRLPIIRYFQNFRYLQPFLALAAALLAGRGLDLALWDNRMKKMAALIAGAVALWIVGHLFVFRHLILHAALLRDELIAASAAGIVIVAAAFLLWRKRPARGKTILAATLILLNGAELALYFALAVPLFGPNAFPLTKIPAVDFIKVDAGPEPFRIYATDQRILHPNLAGLYGLSDLRDQSPLYLRSYVDMMAKANGWKSEQEIMSNFLADGKFYFDLDWNSRTPGFLGVYNVLYILSRGRPGARPLADSLEEVKLIAPEKPYVALSDTNLNGVERRAFLAHAPSRLELEMDNPEPGKLNFDFGLLPQAAQCPGTDGVTLVSIRQDQAGQTLAAARTLKIENENSWRSLETELPAGKNILFLSSLPGPRDDRRCDYAAVSAPEFLKDADPKRSWLVKVYDREVQVYKNLKAWPRVIEANSDEVNPALISEVEEGFGRLSFKIIKRGEGTEIITSNSNSPGWRAWVHEEEIPIQHFGNIMQVKIPPGENQVLLAYVPTSFRVGLWYRVVGLAFMIGAWLTRKKRKG